MDAGDKVGVAGRRVGLSNREEGATGVLGFRRLRWDRVTVGFTRRGRRGGPRRRGIFISERGSTRSLGGNCLDVYHRQNIPS